MGVDPRNYQASEEHAEASQKVLDVARANGLVAGTHCNSPEEAKERFEQGFVMCPALSDAGLMATAARNALERAKTPEADASKPFTSRTRSSRPSCVRKGCVWRRWQRGRPLLSQCQMQ